MMPRKKQLKTHLSCAWRLILVAASAERSLPSKRLTVLKQTVIDSSVLRIQLSHHLFTQWFRKWLPPFYFVLLQRRPAWTPSCVSKVASTKCRFQMIQANKADKEQITKSLHVAQSPTQRGHAGVGACEPLQSTSEVQEDDPAACPRQNEDLSGAPCCYLYRHSPSFCVTATSCFCHHHHHHRQFKAPFFCSGVAVLLSLCFIVRLKRLLL